MSPVPGATPPASDVGGTGGPSSLTPGEKSWAFLLRGEIEEAHKEASRALDRDPGDARAAICVVEAALRSQTVADSLPIQGAEIPAGMAVLGRAKREHWAHRYGRAEALFGEAAARFLEDADSVSALVALEQRATTLQDAGRTEDAAAEFARARQWARRFGRPLTEISSDYGLAYGAIAAGRPSDALRLAERVRHAAEARDLPEWIGHAAYLQHVLARDALDLRAAEAHLRTAAAAYGRSGNGSRRAACLRNLAAVHGERGDYPTMIQLLRDGEALAREAGDLREASFCLEHRGSVHYYLGNVEQAVERWESSLRLGGDLWAPEWRMTCLANIGRALQELGREDAAAEALARAMDVLDPLPSQRARAGLLSEIGRFRRRAGDVEGAATILQHAIESAREWDLPLVEGGASVELGRCHLLRGEVGAAAAAFQSAERIAARGGSFSLDLAVLSGLAEIDRERRDLDAAWSHLELAMDVSEKVRREARSMSAVGREALVRPRALYEQAVDLLYETSRQDGGNGEWTVRAFHVVQRGKARAFGDLLAESGLDLDPLGDADRRQRSRTVLEQLARLTLEEIGTEDPDRNRAIRLETDRLEDELAVMEKEAREADPRYAEVVYPQPAQLDEVQETLRAGELLLEFQLGDSASYLLAATRKEARFVALPSRSTISRAAMRLLPYLSDYNLLGPDPTYYRAPAATLFEMLLGGVRDLVLSSSRLLVSPDGALHYLPLEALLVEDDGSSSFEALDYLVSRTDVAYVPSATALVWQRRRPRDGDAGGLDLLLVAGPVEPVGSGPAVRALSGGRSFGSADLNREAALIPARFPPDRSLVLSGERATSEALAEALGGSAYRFVHFATHGVFNERRPRFSGLVLAPSGGSTVVSLRTMDGRPLAVDDRLVAVDDRLVTADDGFLTVDEVCRLDLECEQVVLSACSSALGEDIRGEGVSGLTRAFLYAGASSVVASLWEVSGEATAELMSRLYAPSNSGSDRPHALAEAKRAMIRSGVSTRARRIDPAHPYAWAGFVLIDPGW